MWGKALTILQNAPQKWKQGAVAKADKGIISVMHASTDQGTALATFPLETEATRSQGNAYQGEEAFPRLGGIDTLHLLLRLTHQGGLESSQVERVLGPESGEPV